MYQHEKLKLKAQHLLKSGGKIVQNSRRYLIIEMPPMNINVSVTPIFKSNDRIQDGYGNRGRVINPLIRLNIVRVKMDNNVIKDYDQTTIKLITV